MYRIVVWRAHESVNFIIYLYMWAKGKLIHKLHGLQNCKRFPTIKIPSNLEGFLPHMIRIYMLPRNTLHTTTVYIITSNQV